MFEEFAVILSNSELVDATTNSAFIGIKVL